MTGSTMRLEGWRHRDSRPSFETRAQERALLRMRGVTSLVAPCYILAMRFSLTTWNINSVRLRIDIVAKFLKSVRPDVLCLQETKCIDDAFPLKRFKRLGYEHVALNGQKGYHGVAIVSKLPFETTDIRTFCDNIDSRHISVAFGEKAQF